MTELDLHELVETRVKAIDQLYTSGRRRLVTLLDGVGGPITTPEILERDKEFSQSSVYRNLSVLESAGVVSRVVTTGEFACYELAEDLTEHHHHMICASCGGVDDFQLDDRFEALLHDALGEVATTTGFVGEHHRLDLVGLCAKCT